MIVSLPNHEIIKLLILDFNFGMNAMISTELDHSALFSTAERRYNQFVYDYDSFHLPKQVGQQEPGNLSACLHFNFGQRTRVHL